MYDKAQERKIPSNQIIIYGHSVGGAIAIDVN
jgi:predicted esterase